MAEYEMTTEMSQHKSQYLTIGNVTVLFSISDQFCKNDGITPRMVGQVGPTPVPVVPMVTMVVVMPPKKRGSTCHLE